MLCGWKFKYLKYFYNIAISSYIRGWNWYRQSSSEEFIQMIEVWKPRAGWINQRCEWYQKRLSSVLWQHTNTAGVHNSQSWEINRNNKCKIPLVNNRYTERKGLTVPSSRYQSLDQAMETTWWSTMTTSHSAIQNWTALRCSIVYFFGVCRERTVWELKK